MKQIDPKILDALVRGIASKVIKETLAPMQGEAEEDRQDAMAAELQSLKRSPRGLTREDEELDEAEEEELKDEEKSSGPVSKKIATGKEEPKKPKVVIPTPTEIKDVTFAQVVNMMNMMRSGKSAKDPETKNKLGSYFKGLNPGERQALFVLLSGLTQILAAGVDGTEAPDPSQVGISIKPKPAEKDTPAQKTKVASKTPGAPASISKSLGDEAEEDLPIVVGEAADKSKIKRKVSMLRLKS